MGDIKDDIIDAYTWHCKIEGESYRMMGKMLDENLIKERLKIYDISSMYVYGGTYLAAQLCRAVKGNAQVKAVIDKGGRSVAKVDVPIITLNELKDIYNDEKIIITPPRFYKDIARELSQFIDQYNLLFLGEFLEGLF